METNELTYKDRELLVSKFHDWCYQTNALNTKENFLVFLDIKGLIKIEESKRYLKTK